MNAMQCWSIWITDFVALSEYSCNRRYKNQIFGLKNKALLTGKKSAFSCFSEPLVSIFNNAVCQQKYAIFDVNCTEKSPVHEAEMLPEQRGRAALFNLTAETLNRTESDQVQCRCQTIVMGVQGCFTTDRSHYWPPSAFVDLTSRGLRQKKQPLSFIGLIIYWKVMPSNCLFCQTNSPKPQNI